MKTAVSAELVRKVSEATEGIGRSSSARFILSSELEIVVKYGNGVEKTITISPGQVEIHLIHGRNAHKPSTPHYTTLTRTPKRFTLSFGKSGTFSVSDILDDGTMIVGGVHNDDPKLHARAIDHPLKIN